MRSFGKILSGELVHLLFDFRQVVRRERLLAQEFVEKAVVDRRADAQLHVRIQLHHRGGQQVCGGMTENIKRVGIFLGQDVQLDVLFERTAQVVKQAAIFRRIDRIREDAGFAFCAVAVRGVYLGDQRGIRQPR